MIITVNHCRMLGFCTKGIKRRARAYKIDLRQALYNGGIEHTELLEYDDPLFNELVEQAIQWEAKKSQ